jgi:hypothetical protein
MACKFQELGNRLHVGVSQYKSDYVGSKKADDELAKKTLFDWAYSKRFVFVRKSAEKLDCHETEQGDYVVWPIRLESTSPKRVVISKNQRCQCSRRIAFQSQCAHEYVVDGAFVIDKWWDCFYNHPDALNIIFQLSQSFRSSKCSGIRNQSRACTQGHSLMNLRASQVISFLKQHWIRATTQEQTTNHH